VGEKISKREMGDRMREREMGREKEREGEGYVIKVRREIYKSRNVRKKEKKVLKVRGLSRNSEEEGK
jgi:hypothetical protein